MPQIAELSFGEETSLLMWLGVLLLIWLALAFLSSFARALLVLNGSTREMLAEAGDATSLRVLKLIEEKNTVQLSLNVITVLFSVFFAVLSFQVLARSMVELQIASPFRFAIEIILITVLSTIAGKIIPKTVAMRKPLAFCKFASVPVMIIYRIGSPVTRPLANWFKEKLGYGDLGVHYLSGEDLKAMADMGEAQGTIEEDEREFIHSIMDFGETAVREVMVSRMDIDALPVTATLNDALELIQTSGHSRLPLYDEHLDHILGVIYVKDLLPYLSSEDNTTLPDWRSIARKPLFVPASKPLDDLLRIFQAQKTHLAIVVDDYGGTAGVATMEDLLEEIVGDIRDEYDQAEEDLHERLDDLTYVFDARIHLDDLCEVLNIELDLEKYDFETLGGLIFHLTGEIPEPGDNVVYEPMSMRIESTDNHRIGRVLVRIEPPTEDKSMAV